MNKYLMMILMTFGVVSCTVKDAHYYRTHPKELHLALKACPDHEPQGLSCAKLTELSGRMNQLGYQMQSGAQNFGGKILALEQTIAGQEQELTKNRSDSELKTSLVQNKKELAELLVVVKWLQSPEG